MSMARRFGWVLRFAVLSALLLCAPASALQADKAFAHYVLDSWSIQDGLPQITATALAQDQCGYLWVGTQAGLARFDGVRFIDYTRETTPQLAGLFIRALLVDRQGRLWIGTYKGLTLYESGHFRQILPRSARWSELDVTALAEQADGTIMAATPGGVFQVVGDRLAEATGPTPALVLLARSDGLWVGTTGAVERIANGRRARLALPADASGAAVVHLVEANGQLWAGTTQGLFVLAPGGWLQVRADPSFDRSPVNAMLLDDDDNLWVGTSAGLARFRHGALTEFVPDQQPGAFRQIVSMLEDREGDLWFGSQLNGLARLWNGWTHRYGTAEGLNEPIVWSLAPGEDDRIWVGTGDGLSLLERGHFRQVVPGAALPHPNAYNLLAEGGTIWIGTRRGLVVWRDGRLESPAEFAAMAGAQINGIVRGPDRNLWFATTDGLFHESAGELQRIGPEQGLRDPRVRVLLFESDGSVLLGTQSGLYRLQDGRARRIGEDRGLPADADVSALHRMHDGRLILGTLGERLYVEAGHRWHELGPAQGMPGNAPFFIAEDGRGYLWVAGIRGISRVPVADLPGAGVAGTRVRGEMLLNERGDPNAGQQGYCCNGAGMSKGFIRDGVLWLPSRNGVVALDAGDIRKNTLPPSIAIERLRTADGWRELAGVSGRLELPSSARDLGFEFTALSFQDPRSVQLRYRLRGYDRGWHRVDDARRRSANYTNLPPGDYTFEVIAANNAGVWSMRPALLRFRIQPMFQETWLFRLLLAALLATFLYAGYRWQQLRHAEQRVALEKQVQSRTDDLNIANARLEKASQTDSLTGLRNRRYLANQIPIDIAYYDRERKRIGDHDRVLLFALIDIDGLEDVNDRYGRPAGDQVLVQFAQVLVAQVRGSDYLARLGGKEFLYVSRPMPAGELQAIGDRFHQAIAAHSFDIGRGQALRLTCSIGLAEHALRDTGQRPVWEQMVDLAFAALDWMRQHGGDGWAAFRPAAGTDFVGLVRDIRRRRGDLTRDGRVLVISSATTPDANG